MFVVNSIIVPRLNFHTGDAIATSGACCVEVRSG